MKKTPARVVLLGHPVGHSLSPVFQNAAIRAAGLSAAYEALDVPSDRLELIVSQLREERTAGNVTIPHKRAMARLCDDLSLMARRTGAVNTFRFDLQGALYGDNTDVGGFDFAARELLGREPVGETVALMGAGGAAAAVAAAVELWPRSVVRIFNRNRAAALALAQEFPGVAQVARASKDLLEGASLVVNATPVGLFSDEAPVDVSCVPPAAAVLDMVYRRGETALVRAARLAGLRAADGREMLLQQGALAFMQWFDYAPDKTVMRLALESAIIG